MCRLQIVWVVALAAVLARVASAETLINADFAKGEQGFVLLGDAKLISADGRQVLSLTQNEGGQKGLIWSSLKRQVPSFSLIAEIRVRFVPADADACPADGLSLNFAPVETDAEGAGGGSLGIFGGPIETFTSFEVNTWRGQGLGDDGDFSSCSSGKHETFAFNVINPNVAEAGRSAGTNGTPEEGGPKIGQTLPPAGMKIVNGGWYRYQWNAMADGTMAVYVTGLEESNRQFAKAKVLEVKFPNAKHIDFDGRWGLSAATGAAVEHVEVATLRVEAPAVAAQ